MPPTLVIGLIWDTMQPQIVLEKWLKHSQSLSAFLLKLGKCVMILFVSNWRKSAYLYYFFVSIYMCRNPNNENFATRWKPSTPQNPCHLSINDRIEMIDTKLNGERMMFWEELKQEFKKDTF